jgi:hypothetical protein
MPAELETGKLASCSGLPPSDAIRGHEEGRGRARSRCLADADQHWVAFSDDAACTNQAKGFFSRLRRAEFGQHHHISSVYLAFCALPVLTIDGTGLGLGETCLQSRASGAD